MQIPIHTGLEDAMAGCCVGHHCRAFYMEVLGTRAFLHSALGAQGSAGSVAAVQGCWPSRLQEQAATGQACGRHQGKHCACEQQPEFSFLISNLPLHT